MMSSEVYYLKQTVFPSRMINHYFHDFTVRLTKDGLQRYSEDQKQPVGLRRRMLSSAMWQELTEPSESMQQFLEGSDDDLIGLDSSQGQESSKQLESSEDDDFAYVDIYIGTTAMSVNLKEPIKFYSSVLSAAVLPGNDKSGREDTLIVTLESGLLLLIRLVITDGGEFEPIIVQRLNLYKDENYDHLLRLGYKVSCFQTGMMISVAAFANVIRLFKVCYDSVGTPYLTDSINLLTGGALLKSCFLEPVSPEHVMVLNLIVTDDSLLQIEFNEFFMSQDPGQLESSIKKSVFSMLSVKFELPYFSIPLKQCKGVLLVQETQCCIRGLNYFISRDEEDRASVDFPFTDFRPNAYYVPKTRITCLPCEEYDDPDLQIDQVLLSEAHPAMWLLETFHNLKKNKWHMKLRRLFSQPFLFSHFSMEEDNQNCYELTYANERGITESRHIQIVSKNGKFGYRVLENRGYETNWFPLYDYAVTPTQESNHPCVVNSNENLWCLGRSGKKSSLFCVRKGIHAEKSARFEQFHDATDIHLYMEDEGPIFIISYPFKTVVACPSPDNSAEIDILDQFCTDRETIHFGLLPHSQYLQVFDNGWRTGTFDNFEDVSEYPSPVRIILASSHGSLLALAYEKRSDDAITVGVEVLQSDGSGSPIPIELPASQPSMLQFIELNHETYLAVGDFDSRFHLYHQTEQHFELLHTVDLSSQSFNTCHELVQVSDDCLLVTSVNGSYSVLNADPTAGFLIFCTIHLGYIPLQVIPKGDRQFYLVGGSIWRLDLNRSAYPERVWVAEGTDRSCTGCVLLPKAEDVTEDTLLALRDDGLTTLYLSDYSTSNVRKIGLGMCGLKLFYYEHQRLFITITDDHEDKLLFADHNRLLQCEDMEILRPNEYPVSLFQWDVTSRRIESHIHHHLVIGCITPSGKGSVKIVELKRHRKSVNLRLLHTWEEGAPVYAINQLSDSTLIFGSGKTLCMKRYLADESKMSETVVGFRFLSDARGIDVKNGKDVLVTTASNSFYRFKYKSEELEFIQGDSVAKVLAGNSIMHNFLGDDEDLITVADKSHCTVTTSRLTRRGGLFNCSVREVDTKVSYIPRLVSCDFKPVWREKRDTLDSFLSAGLSGQFDLFSLVTKRDFDLLVSCLQSQYNSTKGKRFLPLRDLTPLETDKVDRVVDGDYLIDRLQELGNLQVDKLLHESLV